MRTVLRVFALALSIWCFESFGLFAQAPITLSPSTSPSTGQAGITTVSIAGSGFPADAIQASDVTISLSLAPSGPPVTAPASSITTLVGTTRRITFMVPGSIVALTPAPYLISVSGKSTSGAPFSSANQAALTVNPAAQIASIVPSTAQAGQSHVQITITGQYTNFVQGATLASIGSGVAVGGAPEGVFGPVTVTSPSTAIALIGINANAAPGPRDIVIQTGPQQATRTGGFTVGRSGGGPDPVITDFNPKSGSAGTLVTVTGANFTHNTGTTVQIALAAQAGGPINAPVATFTPATVNFTIPPGATTGPLTLAVNNKTAVSANALNVVASADFTLSALPASADLIRGQSVSYTVKLASGNGFSQLAALAGC